MSLKPTHSAVARYLAMGLELKAICQYLNLDEEQWQTIVTGELFRAEVRRVQGEIEDAIIEKSMDDPLMVEMRNCAKRAVIRLGTEIDNEEKELGATSTSRISAATNILDRLGYHARKEGIQQNVVVINMSQEKLAAVSRAPSEIPPQKDSVTTEQPA